MFLWCTLLYQAIQKAAESPSIDFTFYGYKCSALKIHVTVCGGLCDHEALRRWVLHAVSNGDASCRRCCCISFFLGQ